jgi:NADH-quinone oxidoreductase subunit J
METAVFLIAGGFALIGALGVVLNRNPVHAALSLVMTLFAVAVLFVAQEAHLLAAVQVIVYAGAIVVLFLFVIMLLGVDTAENLEVEPIAGQRPLALGIGVGVVTLAVVAVAVIGNGATGAPGVTAPIQPETVRANIQQVAEVLFTDQIVAFELTALLLTVAVVGAVVLARKPQGDYQPAPESALDQQRREAAESIENATETADEPADKAAEADAEVEA